MLELSHSSPEFRIKILKLEADEVFSCLVGRLQSGVSVILSTQSSKLVVAQNLFAFQISICSSILMFRTWSFHNCNLVS